jgi:histidine triad (HIT) family protein
MTVVSRAKLGIEGFHIMPTDSSCIFCNIVAGQIPSRKVYEDREIFAFHDINPWAPVHFLVIPKEHISSMAHLEEHHAALMGRIMMLIPKLALQEGCNPYPGGGFRMVSNTGEEGGQEVQHLHIHVIGGARPWKKG